MATSLKGKRPKRPDRRHRNVLEESDQQVLHTLQDMFIDVFDLDIIQNVTQNCRFNLHESIEALMSLSEDIKGQKSPPAVKTNTCHSLETFASKNKTKFNQNVSELPLKPSKGKHNISKVPGSKFSRQPRPQPRPQPWRKAEMTGLGAIKVAYRGMNQGEDDSDAELVIEEESEFEIVGGNIATQRNGWLNSVSSLPQTLPVSQDQHLMNSAMTYMGPPLLEHNKHTDNQNKLSKEKLNASSISSHNSQKFNSKGKPDAPWQKIQKNIMNRTKIMVLMRGLPGSGKSHLAKLLIKRTIGGDYRNFVFSTDDYFYNSSGKYIFDPSKLPDAHDWNNRRVESKLRGGITPVVVDNTNLQAWEMHPYAKLAIKYGYILEVLEPYTPWRFREKELAERNIHGVPRQKIRAMLERYEEYYTGNKLLSVFNLKYAPSMKHVQPVKKPSVSLERKARQRKRTRNKMENTNETILSKHVKDVHSQQNMNLNANIQFVDNSEDSKKVNELDQEDEIVVHLAKCILEDGKTLDPALCNTKLSNGMLLGELLSKGFQLNLNLKQDKQTPDVEKNLIDVPALATDETTSEEYSSEEDLSCEESSGEMSEEDSNDGLEMCEYDTEHTDIEKSSGSTPDKLQEDYCTDCKHIKEEDEPNVCREYVVVLKDSTFLYQRYHEEHQTHKESSNYANYQEPPTRDEQNIKEKETDTAAQRTDLPLNKPEVSLDSISSYTKTEEQGTEQSHLLEDPQETTSKTNHSTYYNLQNRILIAEGEKTVDFGRSFSNASSEKMVTNVDLGPNGKPKNEDQFKESNSLEDAYEKNSLQLVNACDNTVNCKPETKQFVTTEEMEQWLHLIEQDLIKLSTSSGVSSLEDASEIDNMEIKLSDINKEDKISENIKSGLIKIGYKQHEETNLNSSTDLDDTIKVCTKTDNHFDMAYNANLLVDESTEEKSHENLYTSVSSSNDSTKSMNCSLEIFTKDKDQYASTSVKTSTGENIVSKESQNTVSKENAEEKSQENLLLESWEHGSLWESIEQADHKSTGKTKMLFTPKPERQLKRERIVVSNNIETGLSEKEATKEPLEVVEWNPVSESSVLWDAPKDTNVQKQLPNSHENVPKPQREIFIICDEEEVVDSSKLNTPTFQVCDQSNSPNEEGTIKQSDNQLASFFGNNVPIFDTLTTGSWAESDMILNGAISSTPTKNNNTVTERKSFRDTSSNTHHTDFSALNQINCGLLNDLSSLDFTILNANSRSIISHPNALPQWDATLPLLLMLDKSSMTEDDPDEIFTSITSDEHTARQNFFHLEKVFSHIPHENLKELFVKCNGDVNWTAELLLESGIEPQDIKEENVTEKEICDVQKNETFEKFFSGLNPSSDIVCKSSQKKYVEVSKTNGKNSRKEPPLEHFVQLKKQWEGNFVIDDSHYSPHTLRIKKIRHGELVDMGDVTNASPQDEENASAQPSTSNNGFAESNKTQFTHTSSLNTENNAFGHALEGVEGKSTLSTSVCSNSEFEEGTMGLDGTSFSMCSDDLGNLNATVRRPTEEELEEIDAEGSCEEDDEILPLTLDRTFVNKLHQLFGNPALPFPPELAPTVNIPLSLARQLHCYLMETQQNHYEQVMKEDEEFARRLQEQERYGLSSSSNSHVPDLREIMDMEVALALYKADQSQWKQESKDDMATKLSKQMLYETFPQLDREVLMEVFCAHGNSFQQTLDVLVASTGQENEQVRNVFSPEARLAQEKALLEKAKQESAKNLELCNPPLIPDHDDYTKEQALSDANYYRAEAIRHFELRNECNRKAQEAHNKGIYAVASYYSQVAALHKQRIDDANARAASSLLTAHSLSQLSTTLDLHFLYVAEALQVLDMFLDHHVSRLKQRSQRQEHVFLITGRGSRSAGGKSRIRPAIVRRLQQRNIRYSLVNPGLLKAVVTRNIVLSDNCAHKQ
uniref:NEDD4-binding protein 2 n=1 Tax=Timema monikensis TaxID=170555 RepID=A0A7R9E4J8_9NEOP|nr:unnamed protein product [Timema monikensis]